MSNTPFIDTTRDEHQPGLWHWEMWLDEVRVATLGGYASQAEALAAGREYRVMWLQTRPAGAGK